MGVEDCVQLEEIGLWYYVQNSSERLLDAVKTEGVLGSGKFQSPKEARNRNYKERFESWKSKPLHGQIQRQTEDVRNKTSWNWMQKGDLKKETEMLITAAQDQALRTNAVKAHIEKQDISPLCNMCGVKEESVGHLIYECSKLAQYEYKYRHDNVARIVR